MEKPFESETGGADQAAKIEPKKVPEIVIAVILVAICSKTPGSDIVDV